MSFQIIAERPQDAGRIDILLERTFGPERKSKTVYRLRDGYEPVVALSFVAVDPDKQLLGSIRYWPTVIGKAATPAILLGPLAVEPSLQGRGIGRALVRHSLAAAKRQRHRLCLVVGAPEYYGPYGFENAGARKLRLPGPVEPDRFQVFELRQGALKGVSGLIAPAVDASARLNVPHAAKPRQGR
ncbi:N-acetyltransferase [Limibacillus sp. MBR-115]|jgi:predicted N-acetyltransferase YhbS|uniref:GNAT family N-acetyltransferase n=1 Tax=Limibacillus sp. MBR-115 TaxID=3156465 RepID=UPI0033909B6D